MSNANQKHFIFDVDGCLTPKSGRLDIRFYPFIHQLSLNHPVSIVTGSEISTSIEQIGEAIVNNLYMSFNCMGNVVYKYRKMITQSFWYPDKKLIDYLWDFISFSPFPYKTAKHFDLRTGSLNVSIVGRNASPQQRLEYLEYDTNTQERLRLAQALVKHFPEIEISLGGNISLDIHPLGKNKSQILNYLEDNNFSYFGDGYGDWGNDRPLFDAIHNFRRGVGHKVDNWQQTMQILREEYRPYFNEDLT